jgi:DNA topoisomerase-1
MRVAQQLYEQGLITYMRTDSLTVSKQALEELRKVIGDRYGSEYVPEKPNFYRSKSKNAQEAHEAIRPTSAALTPKDAKSQLKEEQAKLYDMIWKRTMACQMSQALVDTVAIEFDCGEGVFRANGSVVTFPGFLKVYQAPVPKGQEEQDTALPDLQEGETVAVDAIRAEQHFTEPPPRYSEASLVKALEDYGIGRPSTYASIIQTLQRRGYVEMDRRRFIPTDTGRVVARFLENHFEPYVDYEFTARMEDELDAISRGEVDWIPPLERFWKPFIKRVREKEDSVSRQEAKLTRELGTDPKTGKPVSVRLGKYGPHAQIGSIDDEDKPRFAGLGQGQRLETITLEEALELFKLPRELGFTPEGEPVSAAVGRYGPYIRYGNKFVSLKDADPRTVALSQALELIADKKKADLEKIIRGWPDSDVQILKGRWGPYIADGKKNARIPKDLEPDTLTLEQCQELLAAAPDRKGRGKKKAARKKAPKKAPKKATKKTAGKKATAKKTPASKKKASRKRKASAA